MRRKEAIRKQQAKFIEENGVICLDNVSKSYSTGSPALNGISLKIHKGEFVFIVGDSGSGKSTLIKLLLRELVASSGQVSVMGKDMAKLRRREIPKLRRNLGVVFQDFRLLNDRNVYENVAFAQRIIEVPGREIRRNVPAILATVGLAGKYKAKTKQLSGGEQQRVAIARAIAHRPRIILADEPTAELDSAMAAEVARLFQEMTRREHVTIVMTTHDTGLMDAGDMVIELENGRQVRAEEESAGL